MVPPLLVALMIHPVELNPVPMLKTDHRTSPPKAFHESYLSIVPYFKSPEAQIARFAAYIKRL